MNKIIQNYDGSLLYFNQEYLIIERLVSNGGFTWAHCRNQSGNESHVKLSDAVMVISKHEFDQFMELNSEWRDAVHLEDEKMIIDADKMPFSQYGFARQYDGTIVLANNEYRKNFQLEECF